MIGDSRKDYSVFLDWREERDTVKGYTDERPRSSDFYFSDNEWIPTRFKTNLFLFPPDWSIVA